MKKARKKVNCCLFLGRGGVGKQEITQVLPTKENKNNTVTQ
jgi:hypothetical protein